MSKYDISRVPRELLDALATTLIGGVSQFSDYEDKLEAVREAALVPPPRRTRAEVDAEIVRVVRAKSHIGFSIWISDINRLNSEETEPLAPDPQPYGSSSDESASSPRVDAAAGATFSGPRPTPATKESSDTAGVEAGAAFHKQVAEALGLMDGDNGRYIYADEERCLLEIRDNRRDAESWNEHQLNAAADASDVVNPNRITDHDADQREEDTCSCPESERLHGYMKDIKFLHRQWSDEKALAGSVLTSIGNVVLRWMSNLP